MSFKKTLSLLGIIAVILIGLGLLGYRFNQDTARLSLSEPFASPWKPTVLAPEEPDQRFTLLVTGDVLTARTVNKKNVEKNDYTWPFQETAEILKSADLTFINLETPLTSNCEPRLGGMSFCGSLKNIEGLTYAGVDIVNLANNHIGNQGIAGVSETVTALEQAGLKPVGVQNPTLVEIKGTTIAFLGYNEVDIQPGLPPTTDERMKREISSAKASADLVIVQFHWGAEYQYQPTTNQKRLAYLAIEAGADVVLGNHPHWWQPTEIYQGKHITYSHGNFVFDQMWSQETREGMVGIYTFDKNQLENVEFLPVIIEDYGQPRWAVGTEKQTLLERMAVEEKTLRE